MLRFCYSPSQYFIFEVSETVKKLKHLFFVRNLHTSLQESICTKISVALCRYSDVIPCDKVFYEAGIQCKVCRQ